MGILGLPARTWLGARSAVRAALAIALLCWAALAFAQNSQDSGTRSIGLDILAGENWTPTGIEVRPEDTLSIWATDALTPKGPISPDGMPDSTGDNVVDSNLPHAALIGRIGEGPTFLVGKYFEKKMDATGPLRLRWNLLKGPYANSAPWVFAVELVHKPAPVRDPDDGNGDKIAKETDSIADNVSVAKSPIQTPVPPRRSGATGKARRKPPPAPAPSSFPAVGSWALWLLILLAAAGAAGFAVQRGARARTVKRTRAMLGVAPSLDLAEGRCGGDDLPAEGPAASLQARLDPGAARMEEESGHG
jgi:hypothetical protein